MLKTETVKTHVMFPAELLEAIDKTAGNRKRSKFIVQAVKEKLQALKIQQALNTAAGCWKDSNHPDLKTEKDIRTYLKKTREITEKRIRRFSE
jgi:hypothetical protein